MPSLLVRVSRPTLASLAPTGPASRLRTRMGWTPTHGGTECRLPEEGGHGPSGDRDGRPCRPSRWVALVRQGREFRACGCSPGTPSAMKPPVRWGGQFGPLWAGLLPFGQGSSVFVPRHENRTVKRAAWGPPFSLPALGGRLRGLRALAGAAPLNAALNGRPSTLPRSCSSSIEFIYEIAVTASRFRHAPPGA